MYRRYIQLNESNPSALGVLFFLIGLFVTSAVLALSSATDGNIPLKSPPSLKSYA